MSCDACCKFAGRGCEDYDLAMLYGYASTLHCFFEQQCKNFKEGTRYNGTHGPVCASAKVDGSCGHEKGFIKKPKGKEDKDA